MAHQLPWVSCRVGGMESFTNDISADGLRIVGGSDNATGFEAVTWTQNTSNGLFGSAQGLGHLAGGGAGSFSHAVNPDGSVIVGGSDFNSSGDIEAVRWVETSSPGIFGAPQELGI